MQMGFVANDYAAVENTRILVKLPPGEIITETGVILARRSTLLESNPTTTKIVVERMSQTKCFSFLLIPTRIKTTHVIGDVPSQEPMLFPLDLLLQSLAIIQKWWSLRKRDATA